MAEGKEMTKTTDRTYKFDYLSDEAKETARTWWRDATGHDCWYDAVFEDFTEVCKILGVDLNENGIRFCGFWSQGAGAVFAGKYSHSKGSVERIKEYAPNDEELQRIAESLFLMQLVNGFNVCAKITTAGMYCHEYSMRIDVGEWDDATDEAFLRAEACVVENMRELARWLYSKLDQEYERLMSDENVDESIRINGYEFNEDGTISLKFT